MHKIVSLNFRRRKCIANLLFLLRYSIDSPYILHRYSIVSMDYRWSNDGVTMEYLRRNDCVDVIFPIQKNESWKEKGQVFALVCKNLTFTDYYLCRLALCSRYFAFCLAEPEPWAPVMYFFFFALVLTLPSSCFGLVPPRENDMPLTRISSKSFAIY